MSSSRGKSSRTEVNHNNSRRNYNSPAMEEAEPPECPVCMQPYDAVSAVPRVLTCGHTTCEACLKQLPNPFPNTIRCTVCTLLVKFPNCPSSLPRNLDLLHFSSVLQNRSPGKGKTVISRSWSPENGGDQSDLFSLNLKLWSYEFYCKWKKWVLPKDCILIERVDSESAGGVVCGEILKSFESDYVMGCVLREKENVGLFKVGIFVEGGEDPKILKSSYESRIVTVLWEMEEEKRNELGIMLSAAYRVRNVGKAYGFWYNEDDKSVYMVFEKLALPNLVNYVLMKKGEGVERLIGDGICALGMLGMEMCEILSRLHCEGLVIGFLSMSCFAVDEFGRVNVDLTEIINMGRMVNMAVQRDNEDLELTLKNNLFDEYLSFISPEMLMQLLSKHGIQSDSENRYEVGCASDVWSLACSLVYLIVGKSFLNEMESFLHIFVNAIKDENGCVFSSPYMSWVDKIAALLETELSVEYASLKGLLCRCLAFNPENRPTLTEIWKCMRGLIIKQEFDMGLGFKEEIKKESSARFVILGELFQIAKKTDKESIDLMEKDETVELTVQRDVVEGVSRGHIKCIEMKGHLDSVTGLAIGGGFLFSSSYDKTVHVWSMQEFTLVHSFKGHEHRVMAVVYADGEQPLCISGDKEGVICIWKASFPFADEPEKKLFEEKDWRYSGIHAMAVSGTDFVYTGSGDKLIKAWSLKDYTLSCAMSGHKSVVSSLIVCNGVLYSGSWDGTVRLWSLSDHSPLAVLMEDKVGNVASVLSLSVEQHSLFVGHENGSIKIWHNDVLLKSTQTQNGAVFSVIKNGKWLFSGGWDKTISVQEVSENADGVEIADVGSIACSSTVTSLLYWQGKLVVGQANTIIKVYRGL